MFGRDIFNQDCMPGQLAGHGSDKFGQQQIGSEDIGAVLAQGQKIPLSFSGLDRGRSKAFFGL